MSSDSQSGDGSSPFGSYLLDSVEVYTMAGTAANGWIDWGKSIGQGILATIIVALIPGAIVTYLAHIQSVWTVPVLEGLGAALMCAGIVIMVRAWGHLPPIRTRPNATNIESCIHSWLDNERVSVKNDPSPESYFRLRIILNEKTMTIVRMRGEFEDYVQILADLGTHGDSKWLQQFNDDEIAQMIWDVKVELARAQVGYAGLVNPPDKFTLFRRVPIHHNLTEFIFMSMIGSVEAAMNLVGLMVIKTKAEVDRRQLTAPAPPKPLDSDIPTLEPPRG